MELPEKKGYFTRLIKYVNLQAIDILKEHDNSITVQELIPKILNGKGFKNERYTSCQKQSNLIEYILMHHITSPLILSNGKLNLGKTSEEPTEDKRPPKNDTKTTIDEKLIKQAQPYDNKSILKQGTYVIHSSLGIGLINAVLNPHKRPQYEINFENSEKVTVVAENIRLKVIPDSHTNSQIEDTQSQFESPNLTMSDEITPQQQIVTETQKPEIISESLPAIEQTQPEKDSRYDDELEKFRRGLDNIEFYQD